ncbi:hypothetical protein OROMI_005167 [Orobanche minor]
MAGDRDVGTKLLSEINDAGDNIYDHFFTHLHPSPATSLSPLPPTTNPKIPDQRTQ